MAVARVFAFRDQAASLTISESPAIIADTPFDSVVGIEVVEASDPSPHSAILDESTLLLRRRLAEIDHVPAFRYWFWFDSKVAADNGIGAKLPLSDPARFLPRGAIRKKVIQEMAQAVLAGEEFRGQVASAQAFASLHRYGVRRIATGTGSDVSVGEGGHGYEPSSLVNRLLSEIADKSNWRSRMTCGRSGLSCMLRIAAASSTKPSKRSQILR